MADERAVLQLSRSHHFNLSETHTRLTALCPGLPAVGRRAGMPER